MEQSTNGREMFVARVKDVDYFNGVDDTWIRFKDIFEVYQLDTHDVSLLSCWVLVWTRFRTTVRGVFKE
uniref:Uncharacterized protein n=1 Tax=Oryza punctata TaxID=4537 RepID=A0A0E0MFC0_ORYPU